MLKPTVGMELEERWLVRILSGQMGSFVGKSEHNQEASRVRSDCMAVGRCGHGCDKRDVESLLDGEFTALLIIR